MKKFENQIICGDCLEVMKDWPDGCVDLVLTDPPYSTPVITRFGRKRVKNVGDLSIQGHFYSSLRGEIERLLVDNGRYLCFCDEKFYPVLFATFYSWLNLQLIIWDKEAIGMGCPVRKRHELILYANRGQWEWVKERESHIPSVLSHKNKTENLHGAEKPLGLIERLIAGFSRTNNIILDPFCGSGTTCVAAKNLGRRYIGIDISEEYCQIARDRLRAVETGVPVKEARAGQKALFV